MLSFKKMLLFPIFLLLLTQTQAQRKKMEKFAEYVNKLSYWSNDANYNLDSTIYYTDKGSKLFPDEDLLRFYVQGMKNYRDSSFRDAIAHFTKVINFLWKENANDYAYQIYIWRGSAYACLKEHQNAVLDYSRAIIIEPDYAEHIYLKRILCYLALKDTANAIEDYTSIAILNPNYRYVHLSRAILYRGIKDTSRALTDYAEAIRRNPDSISHLYHRANYYESLGWKDSAARDYTKATRIGKNNIYPLYTRGWFYFKNNQLDLAMADFNAALAINPSHQDGKAYKAAVLLQTRKYIDAISETEKVLAVDPRHAYALNTKGQAQHALGDYSGAIGTYSIAFRVDTMYSDFYGRCLTLLYSRLREFKTAASYIDQTKGPIAVTHQAHFNKAIKLLAQNDQVADALVEINAACDNFLKDSARNMQQYPIGITISTMLSLKGYILTTLDNRQAIIPFQQALTYLKNQPEVMEAINNLSSQTAGVDKKSPRVQIMYTFLQQNVSSNSSAKWLQIIGQAKDESGIQSVRVNGEFAKYNPEDESFSALAVVKPGINTISIEALDKFNNRTHEKFTYEGEKGGRDTGSKNLPPINYHALLIAEENYLDKKIDKLHYPIRDARDLRQILQKNYGFPASNCDTLFNASREEIRRKLFEICGRMGENDNLLIFYAGHAKSLRSQSGGEQGYMIPVSASENDPLTWFSADELKSAIRGSEAKHILFIADACYGGALRGLPVVSKEISMLNNLPSKRIMTSSIRESTPDQSRFIYFLKEFLKRNNEPYFAAYQLFYKIRESMTNMENSSMPLYGTFFDVNDMGGDFIFTRRSN